MIQVKEFIDTDITTAEKKANAFLSKLDESQIINIHYAAGYKGSNHTTDQRSSILVVYRQD